MNIITFIHLPNLHFGPADVQHYAGTSPTIIFLMILLRKARLSALGIEVGFMGWVVLALQAVVVVAVLYAFALVPMFLAGVRDLRLLACAPLFSAALLGILSLASVVIPWNPVAVLLEFVAICLIAIGCRAFMERMGYGILAMGESFSRIWDKLKSNAALSLWSVSGVVVAFVFMALAMSGLSLESSVGTQNYDNPFHYSVVRHILDTGDASAIGAGSVMGTQAAVYPDLWHSMTSLVVIAFGLSIPSAGWVICLALLGVIVPAGLVMMVRALFPECKPVALFLCAIGFELTNYTIIGFIGFGSLFANLCGVAFLPFAVAASLHSFGLIGKHHLGRLVIVVAASVIAMGLAHPSTVFVYGIVMVPMLVAKAKKWVPKIAISVGAIGLWIVLYSSPFFARTVNCLDRTGTDVETGMKYAQRLGLDYAQLSDNYWVLVVLAVAILVTCGVIAWKLRRAWATSWYLVAVCFLVVLVVAALFPTNPVSMMLTGFWYRDEVRLRAIALFLMIPLVCVFAAYLCGKVASVLPRKASSWANVILLVAVALGFCALDAKTALRMRSEYAYATSAAVTPTELEVEFMEEVASITHGEVVLNNFNDNSVWMYPIYGANALVKGRAANQISSMDEDLCVVIEGISDIASEKSVLDAAKRISLKWVVKMSDNPSFTTRFNALGQIDYQPQDSIVRLTPETRGFELTYELNGMQLYRVL